jgi:hypothetical protein
MVTSTRSERFVLLTQVALLHFIGAKFRTVMFPRIMRKKRTLVRHVSTFIDCLEIKWCYERCFKPVHFHARSSDWSVNGIPYLKLPDAWKNTNAIRKHFELNFYASAFNFNGRSTCTEMESATEEFSHLIHKGSLRDADSSRVCGFVVNCVVVCCSCLSYNMFGPYKVIIRLILYMVAALYFLFSLLFADHPMTSLDFSIDLILPAALWPWGRLSL